MFSIRSEQAFIKSKQSSATLTCILILWTGASSKIWLSGIENVNWPVVGSFSISVTPGAPEKSTSTKLVFTGKISLIV